MDAAADRPALLAGLLTRDEFRKEFKDDPPSDRTIQRWEAAGLPVIRRGNLRLYDIAAVRAWLVGDRHPRKRRAA